MCTIIAKRFHNIGWVGVKNRDRSASTRTELLRNQEDGIQRVTLMDESTRWSEGMNDDGVSIISSSLVPVASGSEESEYHYSRNGRLIRDALSKKTVDDAVKLLRDKKVSGCVMIFDRDRLVLIEGEPKTHEQVIKEIKRDYAARTNHGLWIPDAGYQPNDPNNILAMRRISSEGRLKIAKHILLTAKNPEELMPLLTKVWVDNEQINTLRKPIPGIDTRTTEQLMLDPGKKLILIRNVNGVLDFDQSDANPPGSKILVGVVNF